MPVEITKATKTLTQCSILKDLILAVRDNPRAAQLALLAWGFSHGFISQADASDAYQAISAAVESLLPGAK